jgi:hypothetical protein
MNGNFANIDIDTMDKTLPVILSITQLKQQSNK